jgi:hypothetical protein
MLKDDIDRLQKTKEEKVLAAERIRELQLLCLENAFSAERKGAEDEYEVRHHELMGLWRFDIDLTDFALEPIRRSESLSSNDCFNICLLVRSVWKRNVKSSPLPLVRCMIFFILRRGRILNYFFLPY